MGQGCFRSVGSVPEGVRYSRYSMRSFRGEALHNSRVGGLEVRAAASPPQEMLVGLGGRSPPSKIIYLMSVSVRFGICFGSAGFALKPYMKPTLIYEMKSTYLG